MERRAVHEEQTGARTSRCEYCGAEIARYEPLWLELHDGEIRLASAVALERELLTGRMWHAGCLRRPALVALR